MFVRIVERRGCAAWESWVGYIRFSERLLHNPASPKQNSSGHCIHSTSEWFHWTNLDHLESISVSLDTIDIFFEAGVT